MNASLLPPNGYFSICWVSVDGAGRQEKVYPDRDEAILTADEMQVRANERVISGYVNPWEHRFFVRDAHGNCVHRCVAVKAHKAEETPPDIKIVNPAAPGAPGGLFLFEPHTLEGRAWLEAHTDGQWWGGALVVEHRYADMLAVEALDAGMAVI